VLTKSRYGASAVFAADEDLIPDERPADWTGAPAQPGDPLGAPAPSSEADAPSMLLKTCCLPHRQRISREVTLFTDRALAFTWTC